MPGPAIAAALTPATLDPASLLALQRSAGNAATLLVLQRMRAAAEADDGGPGIAPHGAADPAAAIRRVLHQPGHRLPAPVRRDMEARLGADFASVRLHTGPEAESSATGVGARAYTSGEHIVLNRAASADRHTLAHELVHVVQQRQGPVAGTDTGTGLAVSDPGDRFERAAEATATRALAGGAPWALTDPGDGIDGGYAQRSANGRTLVQRGIVEEAAAADDEGFLNTLDLLNPKATGAYLWVTVGGTPLDRVTLPQQLREYSLWPIASQAGYHAERIFIDEVLPHTWKSSKSKNYIFELNKTPCPECTKAITALPEKYRGITLKISSIGLYPGNQNQGPTTVEHLKALQSVRGWQSTLLYLDAIADKLAKAAQSGQSALVQDRRAFNFVTGVVSAMFAAEKSLGRERLTTGYGKALKRTKLKFLALQKDLYPRTPTMPQLSDQSPPVDADSEAFSRLQLRDEEPEEELKVLVSAGEKVLSEAEQARETASPIMPPLEQRPFRPGPTGRPPSYSQPYPQSYPQPYPQSLPDPPQFVMHPPPPMFPMYMGPPPQMPMHPMHPAYHPISHMPMGFYPPVPVFSAPPTVPYGHYGAPYNPYLGPPYQPPPQQPAPYQHAYMGPPSMPHSVPQRRFQQQAPPTDVRWEQQGRPPEPKQNEEEEEKKDQ